MNNEEQKIEEPVGEQSVLLLRETSRPWLIRGLLYTVGWRLVEMLSPGQVRFIRRRLPSRLRRSIQRVLASGWESGAMDATPSTATATARVEQRSLLTHRELRDRLAHVGLRQVMRENTGNARFSYIIHALGIQKASLGGSREGVTIVTCTNKLDYLDNIFANYDRQEYRDKELIIVLNNNLLSIEEWREEARKHPAVTVYQVDEKEGLGDCLNFAIEKAEFDYVAKFDDDDYYAPAYVEDTINAFTYSGADIVGKRSYYVHVEKSGALALMLPGREHCFVKHVGGPTITFRRSVFHKVRFATGKGHGRDVRFLQDCLANGFTIYSADRFNFALIRRASQDLHTWTIADEEFLASAQIIAHTDEYIPHVTC